MTTTTTTCHSGTPEIPGLPPGLQDSSLALALGLAFLWAEEFDLAESGESMPQMIARSKIVNVYCFFCVWHTKRKHYTFTNLQRCNVLGLAFASYLKVEFVSPHCLYRLCRCMPHRSAEPCSKALAWRRGRPCEPQTRPGLRKAPGKCGTVGPHAWTPVPRQLLPTRSPAPCHIFYQWPLRITVTRTLIGFLV